MLKRHALVEASVSGKGLTTKACHHPNKVWSTNIRYVNRSRMELTVITDLKRPLVVPPVNDDPANDDLYLYMIIEHRVNPDFVRDNPGWLEKMKLTDDLRVTDGRSTTGNISAVEGNYWAYKVEYQIPLSDLHYNRHVRVHIGQLGLTVQKSDYPLPDSLPFGNQETIAKGIEQLADAISNPLGHGLGLEYIVIDNNNPGKEYWMCIDNGHYKMESLCAPDLKSGLYIFGNHTPIIDVSHQTHEMTTVDGKPARYYSFDYCLYSESKKRTEWARGNTLLFETHSEAKEHGGWMHVQARLQADRDVELQIKKQETEALKLDTARVGIEGERQSREVEYYKQQLDTVLAEQKHKRDTEKMERERVVAESKSVTELIKTGGAIVGAVAGLVSLGLTLARKAVQSSLVGPLGWLF